MALSQKLVKPIHANDPEDTNKFVYHYENGVTPLRISIITVTYNSEKTLKDTLESVRVQSYSNIEHIIIDGGSSDNTIAIVKSFPHISKWISEKDNGLFDAMNKGISMATGEIIGILNSDDLYANEEVLSKIAVLFKKSWVETAYGDLEYVSYFDLNKVVRWWKSGYFKRSNFSLGWMPPHPTFFVRKDVYDRAGAFNLSFKRAADYELMLRFLYKHSCTAAYVPDVLVKMRVGGLSNRSLLSRLRANKEDRLAWKMNNLNPYFFTLYLKPLRKIFQYSIISFKMFTGK